WSSDVCSSDLVGLLADARQDQGEVVAGGEVRAAGHGPGGGPAQGAGQGRLEGAEVLGDEGEGLLVEADLGVGEVVVVEEDDGRAPLPGELRDLGEFAVDVEFDALGAHQLAGRVVE